MKTYRIQQKITVFANKYLVYESVGEEQKLVAYAQQKRFSLKEKFIFYTDETKKNIAFELQARSVLDFGARYDIKDASGDTLGVVGKAFGSSLLRSTWHIFSKDEKSPAVTASERSLPLAIFRRLWDIVPFADNIPFFIKYHFDFKKPASDEVVATYEKTTLFRDHYQLNIIDESLLEEYDWRTLVGLGVMMDALQSR